MSRDRVLFAVETHVAAPNQILKLQKQSKVSKSPTGRLFYNGQAVVIIFKISAALSETGTRASQIIN